MEIYKVLKKYFGLDSFKKEQAELIKEILRGKDVLGILPTGYGKSLCYQVPALMMRGSTLVISPLISLMKDQVDGLLDRGIPATFLNSSLDLEESRRRRQDIQRGMYKLIYISPESLKSPRIAGILRNLGLAQVAVDEAHCISIWGHDFRPSYLDIRHFIDTLPKRPVVTAFTATATEAVIEDILMLSGLQDPFQIRGNLDRPNIFFSVVKPQDDLEELIRIMDKRRGHQGIIYCQRKKEAEALSRILEHRGHRTGLYHGGMDDAQRHKVQEDFAFDRIQVVVGTSAFGMGIDKSNVRFVIHMGIPMNLESFYQEAGRAGRDQGYSESYLIYREPDFQRQLGLLQHNLQSEDRLLIERDKLVTMDRYGRGRKCLRSYLLDYFHSNPRQGMLGEKEESVPCGSCSVCAQQGILPSKVLDPLILQNMETLPQPVSRARLLLLFQEEELQTGGLNPLARYPQEKLSEHLEELVVQGQLLASPQGYALTAEGKRWAESMLPEDEQAPEETLPETPTQELFQQLKEIRKEISWMENIAPYIIFHDETLKDIIRRYPRTRSEFMEIRGVGRTKAMKYGEIFIEALRAFEEKNPQVKKKPLVLPEASPEGEEGFVDAFELHQEGKTVEEMARILGVVPGTVVDRLIRDHAKERPVDLQRIFNAALEQDILDSIRRHGPDKLKPLKDDLEAQGKSVEYLDLKVVLYKHFGIRKK